MKKYWLVRPEYYFDMRKIVGADFRKPQIKEFVIQFKNGMYISNL